MKRDPDLLREILFVIEEKCPSDEMTLTNHDIVIVGHTQQEINYHLALLMDAGFVQALDQSSGDESFYWITRLTYSGTEFLELVREDKRWLQTKKIAGQVGSLAIEVIRPVLSELAKNAWLSAMGIPT